MREHLIRLLGFVIIIFVMTSDFNHLLSGLVTTSALAPVFQWVTPHGGKEKSVRTKIHSDHGGINDPQILEAAKKVGTGGSINEDEKQQLLYLKTHLTNVMQQWCLPKLVCELHASITERTSLSEAERGLLSLIRETSLGSMGEVVSRYHFAAHMGQLLSGVQGNGCNYLYPNCPLSGPKVLQMVKKVRVR